MSDERVLTAEAAHTERQTTTAEAVHGDREAESGDEHLLWIAPADLAMVRAIIDAALARRS